MELLHRTIQTNGIQMHVAQMGEGPLVVLCHGFPEIWYSWRHQLDALARSGFRVVAPDQRGYGGTSCPEEVEAYHILNLVADIVGLIHALGEERAAIVGHDWGAPVAWHCALLRPDIFHKVALLSVPYSPRVWSATRPTDVMRSMAGDQQFYILYFQEPGRAEKEMEEDVRGTLLGALYAASGDAPPEHRWRFLFPKGVKLKETFALPEELPPWITEADLEVYTEAFHRTGFSGGLNWYRNIDRNWELTAFLGGAKIRQPAIFIAGQRDGVIEFSRGAYERLEENMPNLSKKVLIPGAGHWVQQERPQVVNDLLIEFLLSKPLHPQGVSGHGP